MFAGRCDQTSDGRSLDFARDDRVGRLAARLRKLGEWDVGGLWKILSIGKIYTNGVNLLHLIQI